MRAWQSPGLRAKEKVFKCRSAQEAKTVCSNPCNPLPDTLIGRRLLPTEYSTNPIRSGASVRNTIRRLRKDSRTTRRRRRAIGIRSRIRKAEPPLTKRVTIDLAQVVADLAISLIRILKLQDIPRSFRHGYLERMTPITRRCISLGIRARVGGESLCRAAGGRILFADV